MGRHRDRIDHTAEMSSEHGEVDVAPFSMPRFRRAGHGRHRGYEREVGLRPRKRSELVGEDGVLRPSVGIGEDDAVRQRATGRLDENAPKRSDTDATGQQDSGPCPVGEAVSPNGPSTFTSFPSRRTMSSASWSRPTLQRPML